MSRLRLRSLLCRVMGHQYEPWLGSPYRVCVRCFKTHPSSVALARAVVDPTLPSPAPASSSSTGNWASRRWIEALSAPAIERAARRAGTADTEAPAPEATQEGYTQQRVQRFEWVTGEDDPYWWLRPEVIEYKYGSSTGAPAPEAASWTSTPTPSNGSPRSRAGSSR